jgi:translin
MDSNRIETRSLEDIAAELRGTLEVTNRAREEALRAAREIIQFSSRTIRATHRGLLADAKMMARAAKLRVEAMKTSLAAHPDIYYAGYVQDAQKEYAEAMALFSIVTSQPIPHPSELHVEPAAYLNGLAEAASECRRYILDRMRLGDMDRADSVLKVMDDIYYELIAFDFPDAITGGLRRSTDALRAVLERTRGDITITLAQRRLEIALYEAGSDVNMGTEDTMNLYPELGQP